MRLYWHPFSIIPRRVRIAIREKGLDCEEVAVNVYRGEGRAPGFLRLNPFGQIPVLEDGDLVIAESIAILEYIEEMHPDPPLLPAGPAERARARQYMLWSNDYLPPAWKAWMAPVFARGEPVDQASVNQARSDIASHLDVLEARLRGAEWLVGGYSLADVCYAPIVTVLDRVSLGDLLEERPAVRAWIQRLGERPAVRDTAPPPGPGR
jgi:glutathione S-transferase